MNEGRMAIELFEHRHHELDTLTVYDRATGKPWYIELRCEDCEETIMSLEFAKEGE